MTRFIFLLLLTVACSHYRKKASENSYCLPDSAFVLLNLKESITLESFKYSDNFDVMYSGQKLNKLDSGQKEKLLRGVINNGFPPYMFDVHLIAKQQKIGKYQPIILWVGGTDYLTSVLLLVDSDCNPVSHLILEGENCEGPFETDSTIMLCPIKYNQFQGNKIESQEVRRIEFFDSGKTIIDSLSYHTEIDDMGQFRTERLDSIRYTIFNKTKRK